MDTADHLKFLLENLSESHVTEVKSWLDLSKNEHKAKIIQSAIALRNNDGGKLVIGFENKTMQPSLLNCPLDSEVRKTFNQDAIQGLISHYASERFEVVVHYISAFDKTFPVILVPSGVKTPVASKRDMKCDKNKNILIKEHAVYVRTLTTNNTVSTAVATWKDWDRLTGICFDNREADIGRFIRRHLNDKGIGNLKNILSYTPEPPKNDPLEESEKWREECRKKLTDLPSHLGYFEFAAIISGEIKKEIKPNQTFLNLIFSANRHLTGLPFFYAESRPYIKENGCEMKFIDVSPNAYRKRVSFWRIQSDGKFFVLCNFDEDALLDEGNKVFSYFIPIWRVGDVLAEALSIAKLMVVDSETAMLSVTFRWSPLKGRKLSSWGSDRIWGVFTSAPSEEEQAISQINIPINTADSALSQYINDALEPLYQRFGGYEIPIKIVESEIQRMLSRH